MKFGGMNTNQNKEPKQNIIGYSQLLAKHPILYESDTIRQNYLNILKYIIENGFSKTIFSTAMMNLYVDSLSPKIEIVTKWELYPRLQVVMLFDILSILGYEYKKLTPKIIRRFSLTEQLSQMIKSFFENPSSKSRFWDELLNSAELKKNIDWFMLCRRNIEFHEKKTFNVLITSTMSSGKSTLINAFAGRQIAKTTNLACTGRMHMIYGKPFEDGIVVRWDDQLRFEQSYDVASVDEANASRTSYESTYFYGGLEGEKITLIDTPGVNSALYSEHGKRTHRAVEKVRYDAIICVLNYEHMGTDDQEKHLTYLKKLASEESDIIFVINKIDSIKSGDSSLDKVMKDTTDYMNGNGFPNSKIFFVSSRSAYLYRVNQNGSNLLDEDEIDELNVLMRKIKRKVNISHFYKSNKPEYIELEEQKAETFEYQCGIGFIEDYIKSKVIIRKEN